MVHRARTFPKRVEWRRKIARFRRYRGEKRVSFEVIALSRIRRQLSAPLSSLTFTSNARKEKRDRPGRIALYKLGISMVVRVACSVVSPRIPAFVCHACLTNVKKSLLVFVA